MFCPTLVYFCVLTNLVVRLVVMMTYGDGHQLWEPNISQALWQKISCVLGRGNDGRHIVCHWVTSSFSLV